MSTLAQTFAAAGSAGPENPVSRGCVLREELPMARIYRPVTIRYVDSEGKRVTRGAPGARRKKQRSNTYRADWTCSRTGKKRSESLSTDDRDEAQEKLSDLLKRERANISDPYAKHRDTPLVEHLNGYQNDLEARNKSEKYISKQTSYITKIIDDCGFRFIADFDASKVAAYLLQRRKPVPVTQISLKQAAEIVTDNGQPKPSLATLKRLGLPEPCVPATQGSPAKWDWSAIRRWLQTKFKCQLSRQCPIPDAAGISFHASNDYLMAIKVFANWLVKHDRMKATPFKHLEKLNVEEDLNRKHVRRPASDHDFEMLLKATLHNDTLRGLSGTDRAVLYLCAVSTGLRASELSKLKIDSFDLDADVPNVSLPAAYSKRRKKEKLPLRSDLVELLRGYFDELLARRNSDSIRIGDKKYLWPGAWPEKASVMLRSDLEAAGIVYQDDEGRFFDFHSLRHTFGTNLAKAGVSPKLAQELMRHSDINLTMNIYTHVDMPDLAAAVERLPNFPSSSSPKQQRATGTDSVVAALVAVKTGDRGNYQGLSDGTDDQSVRLSPLRDGERKPSADNAVTENEPAHKRKPPMRLELMTYALRKRRSAN
jgi:integrase